jgi:hypothetical protein
MQLQVIQRKIYELRGQRVMLDFDLAELYETETRTLNQAVRRNAARFPSDFMFKLTKDEYDSLRSQIVILEKGRGQHSKFAPFAFTEHGVAMLASVLKSEKAALVNIAIVRAFIALKDFALTYKELAKKIAALEQKYNRQFEDVYEALDLLVAEKKKNDNWKKRKKIGYSKP